MFLKFSYGVTHMILLNTLVLLNAFTLIKSVLDS